MNDHGYRKQTGTRSRCTRSWGLRTADTRDVGSDTFLERQLKNIGCRYGLTSSAVLLARLAPCSTWSNSLPLPTWFGRCHPGAANCRFLLTPEGYLFIGPSYIDRLYEQRPEHTDGRAAIASKFAHITSDKRISTTKSHRHCLGGDAKKVKALLAACATAPAVLVVTFTVGTGWLVPA